MEEMLKKKAKNGPHKEGKRVTTAGDSLHQFLCHFLFCIVYSVIFYLQTHIRDEAANSRSNNRIFFSFNSRRLRNSAEGIRGKALTNSNNNDKSSSKQFDLGTAM